MNKFYNSVYFKLISIIVISLLLLIPQEMISGLIYDREGQQIQADEDVGSRWGSPQTLAGPFISIPYYRYTTGNDSQPPIRVKSFIHILPEQLNVAGQGNTQKRYRGIYEVSVYNALLKLHGLFNLNNIAEDLHIPQNQILWKQTQLVLGISDSRGIVEQPRILWNGEALAVLPSVPSKEIVASGVHASIAMDKPQINIPFSIELQLRGSRGFYMTPVGKTSNMTFSSSWTSPSFQGNFLPIKRNISDSGFRAKWKVLHLNRNYPQRWAGSNYRLDGSEVGVEFISSVDRYRKSFRSIRYAMLLILLTFIVFFFVEARGTNRIHPVQYLLVGTALVIFYILLLAFSEYVRFNLAYLIASMAVIGLIAVYVRSILKSPNLTLFIVGLLILLYTFVFVILQLEDYALLVGSIGLFVVLITVMYYSRKFDWYALSLENNKREELKRR